MVVSLPVRSPVQSPVQSTLGRVSATFLDEMLAYGAIDAWDFTSGAYFRGGTYTGNPGLTVTRASEGYAETSDGRLVKFGSGVLRRTDKGILVEGARTNLVTRSQEFDDFAWGKGSGVTVTSNSVVAPDATITADEITFTSGGSAQFLRWTSGLVDGVTYTYTIYAKLISGTPTFTFDQGNGVPSGAQTPTNDWQRFSFTFVCAAPNLWLDIQANSACTIAFWGAQLEAASFASSYIPTEGSTVTRAADVVTAVPTSGTDYPLSLFAEFEWDVNVGADAWMFQIDDGTSSNRSAIRVNSSNQLRELTVAGTQQSGETVSGAIPLNTVAKGALRIETNNIKLAGNGTLSSGDTNATVPATPLNYSFGWDQSFLYAWNYLRRAAIIPSALTDTQLEEITTPGLPPLFASFDLISGSAQYAGSYYSALADIPGYSFTRASEAYYTNADGSLTKFNSGELRIGDQGVLIEGSRTNLLTYSQAFDNAGWTKAGTTTIVANDALAPDGTLTADRLVVGSGTAIYRVQQDVSLISGTTYVQTLFVKKSSYRYAFMYGSGPIPSDEIILDLDTGLFTVNSGNRGSVVAIGDGWYRVAYTFAATSTASGALRMGFGDISNSVTINGDGASGGLVWGAQIEAGAFPSSYIPTEGSTVTRAADVFTIGSVTGLDYPLSLAAEFEPIGFSSGYTNILQARSDASNRADIGLISNDAYQAVAVSGSETVTFNQSTTGNVDVAVIGVSRKYAFRTETDNSRSANGGVLVGSTDTACNMPVSPTTLAIGTDSASRNVFGLIRSARIYSGALSDYWLKRITS